MQQLPSIIWWVNEPLTSVVSIHHCHNVCQSSSEIWLISVRLCVLQNESELFGRTIRVNIAKPMRIKEGSSRPGEGFLISAGCMINSLIMLLTFFFIHLLACPWNKSVFHCCSAHSVVWRWLAEEVLREDHWGEWGGGDNCGISQHKHSGGGNVVI